MKKSTTILYLGGSAIKPEAALLAEPERFEGCGILLSFYWMREESATDRKRLKKLMGEKT